jgi:hypothetical protein
VDSFFTLLQTHGASWDSDMWRVVFSRMLFKELFGGLFENCPTYGCMDGVRCDQKDWLQTSCEAAMCALVDTVALHAQLLLPFFEELLNFLASLIMQDASHPEVSVSGVAIRTLLYIVSVGMVDTEAFCSPFLSCIQRLFNQTAPTQFVARAVAAAVKEEATEERERAASVASVAAENEAVVEAVDGVASAGITDEVQGSADATAELVAKSEAVAEELGEDVNEAVVESMPSTESFKEWKTMCQVLHCMGWNTISLLALSPTLA